jgi:hypothetical protein
METRLDVTLPLAYLPKHDVERRLARLKADHPCSQVIELGEVNQPGSDRGHDAPESRKKRAVCFVLDPETWNEFYPDHHSEYGGMVCYLE